MTIAIVAELLAAIALAFAISYGTSSTTCKTSLDRSSELCQRNFWWSDGPDKSMWQKQ